MRNIAGSASTPSNGGKACRRKRVRTSAGRKRAAWSFRSALDDDLIRDLQMLNNDSPVRQGKVFTHFGNAGTAPPASPAGAMAMVPPRVNTATRTGEAGVVVTGASFRRVADSVIPPGKAPAMPPGRRASRAGGLRGPRRLLPRRSSAFRPVLRRLGGFHPWRVRHGGNDVAKMSGRGAPRTAGAQGGIRRSIDV